MHCRMFWSRWANKVIQVVLTLTYGHPVSSYVPGSVVQAFQKLRLLGHNLSHHRFTQLRKDVMRTSKVQYKWHLLNGLLFQGKVVAAVAESDLRYLRLQRYMGRPYFQQTMRELGALLVLKGFLFWTNWRKALLFVHVPHLFAQWAIVSVNMLQHDGCYVAKERIPGATDKSDQIGRIQMMVLLGNRLKVSFARLKQRRMTQRPWTP